MIETYSLVELDTVLSYTLPMRKQGPEVPFQYSIGIFKNPDALARAYCSYGYGVLDYMFKWAKASTIPFYLGDVVSQISEEAASQMAFSRGYAVGMTPAGIAFAGGSAFNPDYSKEVAYRIFQYTFPSFWLATYALSLSSGVAYAKCCQMALQKCQDSQNTQRWGVIYEQAEANVIHYGGHTRLMEDFAKNPPGFFDSVLHQVTKIRHQYPSIEELGMVRGRVENHFQNPQNRARVFLEAQRMQLRIFNGEFFG